ncbi:hypothetical protein JXA02_04690 [candidate division KSB1 bacterium]|nr:hypothetical protein [candidate division KSB1 bacterium]RQW08685.1 MAG: hypothetical protein EH222_05305 [candidate division KSB1 bacterium]
MSTEWQEFQLADVLQSCADRSSPAFERASFYFIHKYKNYIYKIVCKRCSLWFQDPPAEMSEIINDIVSDVFFLLFRRNARALTQFKATDSEAAFRGYLATISDRMAQRKLQKKVVHTSLSDHVVKNYTICPEAKWQIFDYIVQVLRLRAGKNGRHTERNILLFNLYTLEDYTREMLMSMPLFRNIGHRVVDNVICRSREKLTKEDEYYVRELLR